MILGFVRAAQGQGLNLAVIMHESRALTESKEAKYVFHQGPVFLEFNSKTKLGDRLTKLQNQNNLKNSWI